MMMPDLVFVIWGTYTLCIEYSMSAKVRLFNNCNLKVKISDVPPDFLIYMYEYQ